MNITYRADGVGGLPFLGVVFTHSDQPVALLVYDSISKSELAVFWGQWLDVTSVAGQLCFVQPLVSAEIFHWLRVQGRWGGRGGGGRTGVVFVGICWIMSLFTVQLNTRVNTKDSPAAKECCSQRQLDHV